MGWSAPAPAPKCPACKVAVFTAEAVMACDRTPFHKKCVKCKSCSKALTPATLNEHQTQLYCSPCYDQAYSTHDYSSGSYGGIVTPEDIARREAEERLRLEKAERAKRERRCPGCDMKSYPEDSVGVGELFYHKACLKCTECSRGPDNDTPMMLGPKDTENVFGDADLEPYCKFCFAKRYKISALNISETVTTMVDLPSSIGLSLFPRRGAALALAVTRGVEVASSAVFAPEQGCCIYSIRIRLLPAAEGGLSPQERGFETCQLHSRHWLLMDEQGQGEQVHGDGVVGCYPLLRDGGYRDDRQSQYSSAVRRGEECEGTFIYQSMSGRGGMRSFGGELSFAPGSLAEPTGAEFNVTVARFPLTDGSETDRYIF